MPDTGRLLPKRHKLFSNSHETKTEQIGVKENWLQVKEIFAGVLHLAPEKRADFITQHCSGDERLRLEVESLLSSYNSADLFLESPAVGEVADRFVADSHELKQGDYLNHYQIIRKLGTGGMGEVYLAEDRKLERRVAIKVLNATFDADESNLKRFFQEAKAASALNHPNIIVVYEIGEIDGIHYIVIEFVKGCTLSDAVKSKNLSLEQIVDSSIQIVNALGAAHAVGIIHRDIKPDNIMLRDDGIVKVLDFGLAKLTEKNRVEADSDAQTRELLNTKAGMIMGTVAYMSPEQTRGKAVDARTDIWSFGVVLFQMLTGRQPFPGETTSDIIAAILTTETPRLAEFVSDVPAELERIVGKTLRKSRNARYQTASELLGDLKHFRRDLEFGERSESHSSRINDDFTQERDTDAKFAAVTAGRSGLYSGSISSFISEAVSGVRARPNFMLLSIATLAVLFAGGIFGVSKLRSVVNTSNAFQTMRLTKLTFDGTATNIVSVSPDGKYIVYALRDEGKQTLMVRQVATSSVVQLVPPAEVEYRGLTFTPDGNYIYYTVSENNAEGNLFEIPVLGGNPRKIASDVGGKVTFSPDGKMMAFVRSAKSLMLADSKGGSQRVQATYAERETPILVSWSPDGKTIMSSVYSSAKTEYYLVEVSVDDGTEKRFSTLSWLNINGLAWLADGSGIILAGRDPETKFSQVWSVSYPGGEPTRITNDFSTYLGLGLTADNKSLLAIKRERLFNIWTSRDEKAESTKKITDEEGRDEGTSGVAWAPDGRIVYTVITTRTNDLWIVNADGSGNRQLTFDQGLNFSPVVSPDGRYIAFTSTRTGNNEIWRIDIDGGNPVQLTETADKENEASFTPDGKWIVYQRINADTLATIWKVNVDGGNPIQLTKTETDRPVVSPDGKVFACDYGDPVKLAIFPIEGGEPLKILDLPLVISVKSRVFRWAPDGKALVYTDTRKRNHNLWSQTLDNNLPKQLTFFESGQISRFDVARDGKGFALSRGNDSSDVVMMSDFR